MCVDPEHAGGSRCVELDLVAPTPHRSLQLQKAWRAGPARTGALEHSFTAARRDNRHSRGRPSGRAAPPAASAAPRLSGRLIGAQQRGGAPHLRIRRCGQGAARRCNWIGLEISQMTSPEGAQCDPRRASMADEPALTCTRGGAPWFSAFCAQCRAAARVSACLRNMRRGCPCYGERVCAGPEPHVGRVAAGRSAKWSVPARSQRLAQLRAFPATPWVSHEGFA